MHMKRCNTVIVHITIFIYLIIVKAIVFCLYQIVTFQHKCHFCVHLISYEVIECPTYIVLCQISR